MCSWSRVYSERASAYRGRSWHRALSRNRRRAAAPSRISSRSSGRKNTVPSTWLSSEAFFTGTRLTVIFFSPGRGLDATEKVPVPAVDLPLEDKALPAEANELPVCPGSGDRPQDRHTMASSRLVFPWALAPQITLQAGWKETSSRR